MLKKSKIKMKRRNTEPSMILGPGAMGVAATAAGGLSAPSRASAVIPVHEEEDIDLLDLSELTEYQQKTEEEEHRAITGLTGLETGEQRPPSRTEDEAEDF